jgi:DNA-binding CsgD family transcriptional regulator
VTTLVDVSMPLREAQRPAPATGDWGPLGWEVLGRWFDAVTGTGRALPDHLLGGLPADVVLQTPPLALVAAAEACRRGRQDEADVYRLALDGHRSAEPTPGERDGPGDSGERSDADGPGHPGDRRNPGGPGHGGDLGTPGGPGDRGDWSTACLLVDVAYGWAFGADRRALAAAASLGRLARPAPWTPRLRQLARLAQAEQDLATGALDRAHHRLDELAEVGETAEVRALAAAMTATIEALAGAVAVAERRLDALDVPPDTGLAACTRRFAHVAGGLSAAQRAGRWGASGRSALHELPAAWAPSSLRHLERAVRAASDGHPPYVGLDEMTVHHPLVRRALVAVGVLEVVCPQGRVVAVGGPAERAVHRARRRLLDLGLDVDPTDLQTGVDPGRERHPRTGVEAAALAALAAHRRGDRRAAHRHLVDALDLAACTGVTAPLLEPDRQLAVLVDVHRAELGPHQAFALGLLDRLHPAGCRPPVEPLTDREVEVVRHLPTLMSNSEIAGAMHLSINTVKTHLKSAYRKLGVDGRRDAVRRSRELELL